ncbi:hypothetical protein GCM10009819_05010 [Agromyces tropicus]|uniref:DUF6993 domain-containing protein n=2 Tax=Agromyces tropicus TaxID=555371 RepID=A0ABN2TZ82_9MICO
MAAVVLAAAVALTACTSAAGPAADGPAVTAGESAPATVPPSADADADEVVGADADEVVAAADAAAALATFDEANLAVVAADDAPVGADFVAALAAAGFAPSAMQVGSDTTTLGEPADSIQFAVRIGDTCLIGQFGAKSDGYRSLIAPVLGTGGCLVGATVPIEP